MYFAITWPENKNLEMTREPLKKLNCSCNSVLYIWSLLAEIVMISCSFSFYRAGSVY